MKKIIALSLATLFFVSCKNEEKTTTEKPTISESSVDGTFKVDSTSTVNWVGKKVAGQHNGTIALKDGQFVVENGKITQGKFILDMNSISVLDLEGDEKLSLEGHLKGTAKPEATDHFFNVAKYPEASFEMTKFENVDGKDMMEGDLTIKGKTNQVKFAVNLANTDGSVTLTSPEFEINRTLWDVKYGSKSFFDDLGDKYINDEIALQISIKGIKE